MALVPTMVQSYPAATGVRGGQLRANGLVTAGGGGGGGGGNMLSIPELCAVSPRSQVGGSAHKQRIISSAGMPFGITQATPSGGVTMLMKTFSWATQAAQPWLPAIGPFSSEPTHPSTVAMRRLSHGSR